MKTARGLFLLITLLVLGVVGTTVMITHSEAATVGTLSRLPTSSGGVFTQDNLDQINANITTTNTNFSNLNNAIVQSTGPISLTLAQVQTLHSVPVQLIPAQGANTVVVPLSCSADFIFGSAAYTGGGAITIGYGTGASPNAMGTTIAAAVLTGLAANTYQGLVGAAQAAGASSGYINTAVYALAATADFAAGTGGSAVFNCSYMVAKSVQ